ncbi:plasmid partition protein ParG [Plesiomonas shigelloides subsp. oncorhynchi]|nr:plasmid partition protein ParG [Plesiomonas shigelloides]MDA1379253.1 plasmid partition protein ParG [Plesiomonas shigelloides]MDA1379508.1 plasmid partition protein ParG [Plesiomonas shigelloides]
MKMKLGDHKQLDVALNAVSKAKLPTKKLQMNIDEDLHKRFKLACFQHDREMTEVTIELISNWLKDNEG